ncbi:glucosaminidase domain-containing protein [Candidatus Microgenomates bacterium]|nr:glucosaminidase domain-containing protein [Candidatus Microgenomates bacterium]
MLKRNLLLLLIIPIYLLLIKADSQSGEVKASYNPKRAQVQIEAKKIDKRAEILSKYLSRFNSPLQYHAQDFIDAAQTYNVDWKLVPAISGVESTFGKFIPGGYNAWGWGVYGNQALGFRSWRDGIFTVTRGLKEKYINRGLLEPFAMNRIYAASPYWGGKVTYFMSDLEKFYNEYQTLEQNKVSVGISDRIAVSSGLLALNSY